MSGYSSTVTSAGDLYLVGGHKIVRDSSGIPYVAVQYGVNTDIYYGNAPHPTSWTQGDRGVGYHPRSTSFSGGYSICIDENDVIHCAYQHYGGKASELRYAKFDCATKAWLNAKETIIADTGDDIGSETRCLVDICTANASWRTMSNTSTKFFIFYTYGFTDMGTTHNVLAFVPGEPGSWGSSVNITNYSTIESLCADWGLNAYPAVMFMDANSSTGDVSIEVERLVSTTSTSSNPSATDTPNPTNSTLWGGRHCWYADSWFGVHMGAVFPSQVDTQTTYWRYGVTACPTQTAVLAGVDSLDTSGAPSDIAIAPYPSGSVGQADSTTRYYVGRSHYALNTGAAGSFKAFSQQAWNRSVDGNTYPHPVPDDRESGLTLPALSRLSMPSYGFNHYTAEGVLMREVLDGNLKGPVNVYKTLSSTGSWYGVAQSFTGQGKLIHGASIYAWDLATGTAGGSVKVSIWSHSGTYGTSSVPGSLLQSAAGLDPHDYTLKTTGYTTRHAEPLGFLFSPPFFAENGTYYTLVVEAAHSNNTGIEYSATAGHHSGNLADQNSSSVWSAQSSQNLHFVLWTQRETASIPIVSSAATDITYYDEIIIPHHRNQIPMTGGGRA